MLTEKHLADVMAQIERRLGRARVAENKHASGANKPDVPSYRVQTEGRGGSWHRGQMYSSMREVDVLEWVKMLLKEPERAARTPQMIQAQAGKLADSLREAMGPAWTVKGYSSIADVLEERKP